MVSTDEKQTIKLWKEDEFWIIKDIDTNVTTQGESKIEALLMLADALAAYENSDLDLIKLSEEIFVMDEEHKEFLDSI